MPSRQARHCALPLLLAALAWGAAAHAQPHDLDPGGTGRAGQRGAVPDPEPLLAIDTLLSVDNRGLTRLLVTLNAYDFKLATDADEVAQSANAFLIPLNGLITIDIGDLIEPDDENPFDDDCTAPIPNGNNCIAFTSQGPEGTDAQVIISDTRVAGQPIAYAIAASELEPFPETFERLQGYPNPFATSATLTYAIPQSRTSGIPVSVVVYDVLGRRIRTLIDARQFPGTFRVRWDGKDGGGQPVASGLYLARIEAEELTGTVRLTRLR